MKKIVKFRVWSKIYDKFLEEPFRIDVTKPIEHLDYIFQQFTNYFDAKGREIYEGDVLKSETDKEPVYVEYREAYSGLLFSDIKLNGELENFYGGFLNLNREVIGNILENPELINNKLQKIKLNYD